MRFDNDTEYEIYSKLIDKCPLCNCVIDPKVLNAINVSNNNEIHGFYLGTMVIVTFYCKKCYSYFHAYFINTENKWICNDIYPNRNVPIKFSNIITSLSSEFVDCYNQSMHAQKEDLTELVGSGLRKSVEYLVKSFVIKETPDKINEITNDNSLGNVIHNRLSNDPKYNDIKDIAKRAWWIGSDYTHTTKKYEEYSEEDLLKLIELLVSEIERYYNKQNYISSITRR